MGAKVDKIAMVQYGIDNGASDKEIAEHFRIYVKTWRCYKSDVRQTNPELVDQLTVAQKNNGNRRNIEQLRGKKVLDKIAMVQYGIETGASDEEIIEQFHCERIETFQNYKSIVKKTHPQLIQQLKEAQKARKLEEKHETPTIAELQQENKELKAKIVLLEQELQAYRIGLRQQGKKTTKMPRRKSVTELNIILSAFDKGIISEQDARLLEQYHNDISKQNIHIRYSMSHSNIMYVIRAILSTTRTDFQDKKEEIKKYVLKEKHGPLYELDGKTTIGQLVTRIQNLSRIKVSSLELAMIINELVAEGQADKIKDNINIDSIPLLRSKIENDYDQLQQGLLLCGEER